jgi:3-dehydroquinate dehydratase I
MTTRQTIKARRLPPRLVGVVTSIADLDTALRLPRPADLFELRLDHLCRQLDQVEKQLSNLSKLAPLIITARHPLEGGANRLSIEKRQQLLARFLRVAAYIDIELRSARFFESLVLLANQRKIGRILSFHDFRSTPSVRSLTSKARAAKKNGADIFKVATRTDSIAELSRLVEFFADNNSDLPISAMGIGRLGRASRRKLAELGSVLNYASLGQRRVSGQPSLSELQGWVVASRGRTVAD